MYPKCGPDGVTETYAWKIKMKQFQFQFQQKQKQIGSKESTKGTHNVVHVGVGDAEEVVVDSVLGAAANVEGQFESGKHYAGFVACN